MDARILRAVEPLRTHECAPVRPQSDGGTSGEDTKALKATRGSLSLDLARPTAFIFSHDDGRLRDPVLVSNRWKRRTTAASKAIEDLPHISLHGLRHTHATLLLQLGESPKVVQERLGHGSIAITMNIYSHVSPSMQRAAADRFSALLDGA